jgi:hypothetical protein
MAITYTDSTRSIYPKSPHTSNIVAVGNGGQVQSTNTRVFILLNEVGV